eukprot:1052511_1
MATEYQHVSVKFTVEPQVLTQKQRPCVIYQEIRFAEAINIEFITFRNFYCAFVTIHKYNDHQKNGKNEWIPILCKYKLMSNGHFENDAQNSHIIHNSQFVSNDCASDHEEQHRTSALRFYLIQPSSNWSSFGLRDLMCYKLQFVAQQANQNENQQDSVTTTRLNIQKAALLFSKSMRQ